MLYTDLLVYFVVIGIIIIIINSSLYYDNINVEFTPLKKSDIKYVFWTGGYDSTFRICQLLSRKQKVQPIYIYNIDGEDIFGNHITRKNIDFEIKSMNLIRKKLTEKYNLSNDIFYDTIYVSSVKRDENIKNASRNIYFMKFGIFSPILNHMNGYYSRPYNQYEKLAQYTKNFDYPIDLCIEKTDSGFCKLTENITIGQLDNRMIIPNNNFQIYQKFRLPIMHLSKNDMKDIAIKDGYLDILKLSWSCWYPINDKMCGKCDMCLHRVI